MIVLVIGGTGTLGKHVLPLLLANPQVERVRILSRGEHTQMQMWESLDQAAQGRVDFFVGDCRDRERLLHASRDCLQVFHFAAMKSVDKAEYDPYEAVLTNVQGTKNVIEACLANGVERAIFTSTDKAVAPLNIYGATKLVAEKLFIQANIGRHRTRFSVMRYGNVLGSQGSVLAKWKEAAARAEPLFLTAGQMTRFWLLPIEAAHFVVQMAQKMQGGEVFIPKMKASSMEALFRAFEAWKGEPLAAHTIPMRPGEKEHEVLLSPDEVALSTETEDALIRWPNQNLFPVLRVGTPVLRPYRSDTAEPFRPEELRRMLECQLGSSPRSAPPTWANGPIAKNSSIDARTLASTP